MASSTLPFTVFIAIVAAATVVEAVVVDDSSLQLMTEAMEWPSTTFYPFGGEEDNDDGGEVVFDSSASGGTITEKSRRSLFFWHRIHHYYISYGALSANRIPCPPRSGRSYYTHNCYRARGPVHPYSRGCSAITRCRR